MGKPPLKIARDKRGMTLQDLARLVDSDVGNLSRIERGEQTPSKKLAEKICQQFSGELSEIELFYPERFMDASHEQSAEPSPNAH